ncbi:hypothetical protein BU17DRAFT_86079 [Hysterangium stoloniferum]|nr:hypothetical protein BU17DRAFT_86079 [Hysterangium stoloniferum]
MQEETEMFNCNLLTPPQLTLLPPHPKGMEASHFHTIPLDAAGSMHQLEPSPLMPLKGTTTMSQMEASQLHDTNFHPEINAAPPNIQVEFSPEVVAPVSKIEVPPSRPKSPIPPQDGLLCCRRAHPRGAI